MIKFDLYHVYSVARDGRELVSGTLQDSRRYESGNSETNVIFFLGGGALLPASDFLKFRVIYGEYN